MSDFQLDKQLEPNWCWAAVSTAVCRYFEPLRPLDQNALATHILGRDNNQGESLEAAFQGCGELGVALNLRTLSKWHLNFESIRGWIDLGIPILVLIRWFDGPRGHFVVITGYSVSRTGEGWLDIADPLYENSTLPYDVFVSAYKRQGHWFNTYLATEPEGERHA